jgi:hypothetical protein
LCEQFTLLRTYRSGAAVAIGTATQFLQIFSTAIRSGIWFEEYYLYQLIFPNDGAPERGISRG